MCVFVFDLLLINGEPLVKKTLSERRATMLEVVEKDGVGGVAKGNSPIRGFEVAKSIVVGMQDEEGQENMRVSDST